jgi:hypothetical protein
MSRRFSFNTLAFFFVVALVVPFRPASAADHSQVLHSFKEGTDQGWFPSGGLIMDGAGNLYGTTGGAAPRMMEPWSSN